MKNLIKNVVRSFKNNKISLIGLIFLLFFGLGAFCVMSNTVSNISNQYTSIANQGNLHDFTASELYEIGNAAYITDQDSRGFEYYIETKGTQGTVTQLSSFTKTTHDLCALKEAPIEAGSYYYIVPTQTVTGSETTGWTYTRTYKLRLDPEKSTGLFKQFATSGSKQYVDFEVKVNEVREKEEEQSAVSKAVENLQGATWSPTDMLALINANALAEDYNYFLKGISDRTSLIFNMMTSKDTPLTKKLDKDYSKEVEYRQFKSINVTATKDNIFYKVINSNPTDTIDKIVLFKDPNGNYGNELFAATDWAPYNSQMAFWSIAGEEVPLGTEFENITVPTSFEDLIQMPLIPFETFMDRTKWTNDERFIYSQIVQKRFKRILSGDMSTSKETMENLISKLAAIDKNPVAYYLDFVNDESDIAKAYEEYRGYQNSWSESVIISMNGNIVLNWLSPTPVTCTLVNWTSHFSVINPQHLEATKKHVLDSKWFNDFAPFREWYRVNYGGYPSGTVSQQTAILWFNSLTNKQFEFWRRPSAMSVDKMVYTIHNKEGSATTTVTVTKGTEEGQWNGLPDESIASCGNNYQIVWGCGLSPDFMYPVVDVTRPTPNLKTECLTYVNDAGYKAIRLAFFNSPVEEFLIAKFMPSVTSTRQREIIDELNQFCSENMLYPKDVKAVYMANDTNNVLNSSAFRVSYIPNLISVIQLVTIILCSFLAILALVICLIIIKRYVENNRVNIGIMRANGISKMKIALSLLPFAFVPALIGGIAAYLIGLFLQIPMLKLFGNYWTLPTPIISFDWISMLVCIVLPFILFGIVTIIATLLVLRAKSVDLMKAGSEFKTNSFSKIAKKPFRHFGVLTRFRVALAFNSLSRLIVLALMSCLTMTSLVFAMTSFGKLNKSQVINSSQFDYSFNLKLTTPTTVGGNYNIEDWNKTVGLNYAGYGYENPSEYIYNVSWNTNSGDAENLTKWYSNTAVKALEILYPNYTTNIGKNGNLMLPTAGDANGQKQDLQYLKNKTCSKLTLDYVVGLGSLSSNPWEIALALMPANSRNLASDAYNTIINKIGTYIDSKESTKWDKYRDFFAKNPVDPTKLATPYALDISTKSWLAGFSDEYVKFLVDIYKDPEFMMDEYRISYGIIPTNWFKETNNEKDDELYTYITGKFNQLSSKQRAGFDSNHEITIEGIKPASQFVKLTDSKGQNLNQLLYEAEDDVNGEYNWVIINAYAAHKYNLGVNSTFSINMTNMADRYDRQMHPEEFSKTGAKSDLAKFKVLAISEGTNGEAFYCKQKPANQLLGLPDGDSWNSTHKYMMWQDKQTGLFAEPVRVIDLAADEGKNYPVYQVDGTTGNVVKEEKEIGRFNDSIPTGFNGIYTENKSGKPLTQGLSLYSYSGLYPGSSVFDADAMRTLLEYKNNLPLANFMTGINDPAIYEAYKQYRIDESITETEYIAKGVQPFIDTLRKVYGDTTMVTCICGATDVAASDLIYKNLISTFNLAETTIMSVIIPITIIVVGIISNLIINDSKKMAAMLKALGYSDKKNAMSILALFVPTIVLGLALAIPASMGICIGYQSLIFGSANILIDMSRKWWYYLASVGGIGIILVATYVVGWISLKRDRLVDQIKN